MPHGHSGGTAAVYARFSSRKQHEESIADQLRVCADFAKREGVRIVATYADEARSGTSASGRPEFLRMVSDAERAGWDYVIVYKSDRFARNRYDAATYKSKLRRAGVEILSATEGVPEGPEGIILESVLEGMAEYYSANLAQNVRRGMEGNALKCKHNGVRVFGYECMPDGSYRVDGTEAEGVRAAFRMAANGSTKAAIARYLNHGGWRTARGKRFTVTAVTALLANEKYIGVYSWGGIRKEGGIAPIVGREQWDAAHAAMALRGRTGRPATPEAYLLSGMLYDAEGNRFESCCGRSGGNGRYYYYYRVKSTGESVRKADAEDRVRGAVAKLLKENPELDEAIVRMVMEAQDAEATDGAAALKAMRDRLPAIDRETDNLISLAARTGASDRIARQLKELEEERGRLVMEIHEMEGEMPAIEPDMVRYMLHLLRQMEGPDAVVRGLVDRVDVQEDGSMLVTFVLHKPSDLQKQEKSRTLGGEFGKLRFGSPYQIRTGDLRLERAAS